MPGSEPLSQDYSKTLLRGIEPPSEACRGKVGNRSLADYQRMRVMVPLFWLLWGVTLQLPNTTWNEWLLRGPHPVNATKKALLEGVVAALPWNLKIFVAFFSDALPICGRRRRPYIIIGVLLDGMFWVALGMLQDFFTFRYLCFARVLSMTGFMMTDVVIDAVIVESARVETKDSAGKLQTNAYLTLAIGGMIGSFLSGWLPQYANMTYSAIFVLTGLGKLSLLGVVPFLVDPVVSMGDVAGEASKVWDQIWSTAKLIRVAGPVFFILVFNMIPNSGSSLSSYFIQISPVCRWNASDATCSSNFRGVDQDGEYHRFCAAFLDDSVCNARWGGLSFTPSMFSYMSLFWTFGSLLGIMTFKLQIVRKHWHLMFIIVLCIASVCSAGQCLLTIRDMHGRTLNERAHVPSLLFALGDNIVLSATNQLLRLPIWIMMARLCPEGAEGSVFALLSAIEGVGGTIGGVWSKLATEDFGIENYDWSHLWQLVLFTSLIRLACLPLLPLLPRDITDANNKHSSFWVAVFIAIVFWGGLMCALYQIVSSLLT